MIKKDTPMIPHHLRSVTKIIHGYPKAHGFSIEWISMELWNQFEIRVPESTLKRYLNPNDDLPLPADLIVPICVVCENDYAVLDLIEASVGRSAAPDECPAYGIDMTAVARLAKKAGEAIAVLAESTGDGVISPDEREDCKEALQIMVAKSNRLLAKLSKTKKGEGIEPGKYYSA